MKTEMMGCGNGESQPSLLLKEMQEQHSVKPPLHSELWHACAGPLVSLPAVGSLVYYFPQGHIEQVAVSTKRLVTSQIPNYPNLPSELICQVRNVILHADKDTDEIFAQMSLQPFQIEKDVLLVPDFGLNTIKHPTEFFCKTLTASDTSTHGGFSVPRRAAEKLFPPLDYTMQPPFQELVVKDLHDNTWTFRHIYRGQPKRHLLTTGWSGFVGSKRLRAGDAVLFIRDEKGQLMVGVRRANHQQTTLPSSVLSADSMHIGVLAAAAHAAANRTPFTVFYNPRACPKEFVIPASKYRKAIYGTQTSAGMRFGMMFETEESGKRRYMGTIVGVSDLDPLRWPGSKWRNLQVEWDEPGCSDKHNRVSAWEIETPESLFSFPSLTSGFKRSFHPGFMGGEPEWGSVIKRPFIQLQGTGIGNSVYGSLPNFPSDNLFKMLMRAENLCCPASVASSCVPTVEVAETNVNMSMIQKPQFIPSLNCSARNYQKHNLNQSDREIQEHDSTNTINLPIIAETIKSDSLGELSQLVSAGLWNEDKVESSVSNATNQCTVIAAPDNQNLILTPGESSVLRPQLTDVPPLDISGLDNLYQCMDSPDRSSYHSSGRAFGGASQSSGLRSMLGKLSATIPEVIHPSGAMGQELWDQSHNLNDVKYSSHTDQFGTFSQFSDDTINQSGIYSCIDLDVARFGDATVDASASSDVLNNPCSSKQATFQYCAELLVGNSTQDLQSQITSVSLPDSQVFLRDCPDNSGGTSSSNVDFDESSLLQNNSWQQVVPPAPMRTYTKVQKTGSVGRSIDVTSFKDYDELLAAVECMFGLEGLLNDPKGSGWKLVYVDFENDVLLVGDDPWEEFVGCVRCIRILSPAEVQQMSREGMKLLSGNAIPAIESAV